jgi:hypothetical protein
MEAAAGGDGGGNSGGDGGDKRLGRDWDPTDPGRVSNLSFSFGTRGILSWCARSGGARRLV